MGAAWCRDRAAAAHNSKSPLDRVIVQCVNQICPSSEPRPRGTHNAREPVSEASRTLNKHLIGQPVPVHTRNHPISGTHAINALSSWQEVSLSVPDTPDDCGPPVPPPRKKKIWREQQRQQSESWKTIPRPPPPQPPLEKSQDATKNSKKRRQKTLSSVSLPNYNDLSLSVYTPGIEKPTPGQKTPPRNESCISLPGKSSGLSSLSEATVEKIENCVRRCRSFGAFKPEPLKLKTSLMNGRHSSESDDSFDGLEDWDLRVIEHCEAHEVSPVQTMLPPQRLRKSNFIVSNSNVEREHLQRKISEQSHALSVSKETNGADVTQKENSDIEETNLKVKFENLQPLTDYENEVKDNYNSNNISDIKSGNQNVNNDVENNRQEVSLETGFSSDSTVVVYDFVNNIKGYGKENSQVVNGYYETSKGLRTPPPTPESTKPKQSISEQRVGEELGHSSLLRLLKEYQSADGKLEDTGAQSVLKGLGIPATLRDTDLPAVHLTHERVACTSRGSSGRSSMTPSLSELEAALSDLLEASASKTGAEEEDDDVISTSLVTTSTPVQQTIRVISPKPFSSFSNTFHPIQNSPGKQLGETSA